MASMTELVKQVRFKRGCTSKTHINLLPRLLGVLEQVGMVRAAHEGLYEPVNLENAQTSQLRRQLN